VKDLQWGRLSGGRNARIGVSDCRIEVEKLLFSWALPVPKPVELTRSDLVVMVNEGVFLPGAHPLFVRWLRRR